jgi:hypothetical protein
VLFDGDALYVGVICRDREPKAIVATQLARDADLDVDDHVTIVLDPFSDNRNGFFFQTNAVGARTDGQIANNQESLSFDWDGIWDVATERGDQGWTAEFAIPFKTLRFKPNQTWGFNVERVIKRKLGTSAGPRPVRTSGSIRRRFDVRPSASGGDEGVGGPTG